MIVKEAMTPNAEGIQSDATVLKAAQEMTRLNVGALPVFNGDKPAGIVTDRDVVTRALGLQLNPAHTSVGEIMTKQLLACNENTSLEEAAAMMRDNKVRRLIVEDDKEMVTGIITLGDIAVHSDAPLSGEVLQGVSEPARPSR